MNYEPVEGASRRMIDYRQKQAEHVLDSRIEFLFELGDGPKVLAFVAFGSRGLSFGLPKVFRFDDYEITPARDNYERITVHPNGLVTTHLPLAPRFVAPWDGRFTPLASWHGVWTMREEIHWGSGMANSIRNYLTNPKPVGPGVHQVSVAFSDGTDSAVILFTVLHDMGLPLNGVPQEVLHRSFQTWAIVDAWPHVLVSISGLTGTRDPVRVLSVGRDYRL